MAFKKTTPVARTKTLRNQKTVVVGFTDSCDIKEDSFVKIDKGTTGPKLAEAFITLLSLLSLEQRNEVIELVLRQMVISALNETDDKRSLFHQADKQTERLHILLSGGVVNTPNHGAKEIVSSHR